MPYFVIIYNPATGEPRITKHDDKLRMHEAVDQAVKGKYHDGVAHVYQTSNLVTVNLNGRVNYAR